MNESGSLKTFQKWLLILAVTGLVIGIPVTVSHAQLAPAWTVALPAGAVCLGLFLISLLLQNEVGRFDAEQRSKIESAKRNPHFPSAEDNKRDVRVRMNCLTLPRSPKCIPAEFSTRNNELRAE